MLGNGFEEFADELEEFATELEAVADDLPEAMDDGVRNTAEKMDTEMTKRAPSDSGELAKSITHEKVHETSHDVEYHLGPEADYAHWVEYGTGIHGPKGEKYTILPKGMTEGELAAAQQEARAAAEAADNEADAREAALKPMQDLVSEHGALDIGAGHPVVKVNHPGSEAQPYFHPTVNDAIVGKWLETELDKTTDDAFSAIDRNGI